MYAQSSWKRSFEQDHRRLTQRGGGSGQDGEFKAVRVEFQKIRAGQRAFWQFGVERNDGNSACIRTARVVIDTAAVEITRYAEHCFAGFFTCCCDGKFHIWKSRAQLFEFRTAFLQWLDEQVARIGKMVQAFLRPAPGGCADVHDGALLCAACCGACEHCLHGELCALGFACAQLEAERVQNAVGSFP